jgi:FkbM family methyltransferase
MAIEVFTTRWGELAAMGNDRPISSSLEKYGEWAQIEIEFLAQFLPETGIIVDVGAHVGTHSLAFSSLSDKASVHSFEAQPRLADLLARNTGPLRDRIIAHRCAIGAQSGTGFMPALADELDVNAGAQRLEYESGEGLIEVPIRSLDSFQLDHVSFIKIDV